LNSVLFFHVFHIISLFNLSSMYFPTLFTIQLAFLLYFSYLITIRLAFLPYFPYLNTAENSEKNWKIQKKILKRYGKYGRKVSWIVKR
jgi:hypothetical protein